MLLNDRTEIVSVTEIQFTRRTSRKPYALAKQCSNVDFSKACKILQKFLFSDLKMHLPALAAGISSVFESDFKNFLI